MTAGAVGFVTVLAWIMVLEFPTGLRDAGLTLGPVMIEVLIVFVLMAKAWKIRVVRVKDVA